MKIRHEIYENNEVLLEGSRSILFGIECVIQVIDQVKMRNVEIVINKEE